MDKKIILSNAGFLIGAVGVIIAVIPFFNLNNTQVYNIILPSIFGVAGLILILKIKKELNDDIVKVGFVVNLLAIVLAIIQLVIYLTK